MTPFKSEKQLVKFYKLFLGLFFGENQMTQKNQFEPEEIFGSPPPGYKVFVDETGQKK